MAGVPMTDNVTDKRSIIITFDLADPNAPLDIDLGDMGPIVGAPLLYDAWCAVAAVPTAARVRNSRGLDHALTYPSYSDDDAEDD